MPDAAGKSELTVHERVYRQVRSLILSGALPNGAKLPPSRTFAGQLGVSRNTLLAVLDRMIADGWLKARRGSGVYVTYVSPRPGSAFVARSVRPPSVPFFMGARATDLFPAQIWNKLQSRRWAGMSGPELEMGEAQGWPALCEAIAAHVSLSRGLHCSPQEVVVTTSVPAAIDLTLRALGIAGGHGWVEEPGYHAPKQSLVNCGVIPAPIPVDDSGIDVVYGQRAFGNAKLAVVTSACQFPSCVTMSEERRGKLLAWARENDAWIIEDDYDWQSTNYRELPPPISAIDNSRTIYVNSFNPILFPALRIAYIICPPSLLERFAAVRIGLDEYANVPNQIVLADFMNSGHLDDHLRRLASAYPERRTALVDAMEREIPDIVVPHKQTAGTHVVVTLLRHSEDEFVALSRENGIVVEGMNVFRLNKSDTAQVLFGFAAFNPTAIRSAVKAIRRATGGGGL
ncbi:MAG TPA: PLP-dependent aminotransferase family protein [Rhizomicrobium sp.]|jgi:GntR family transcriptional regulator/MocR family aminotransferase